MSTQKIGTASDAELEKAEQELDDYFDSRKKNPKYYKRPSKDAGYIVMGATA